MKKVIIVDDHPIILEALESIINSESIFTVVSKLMYAESILYAVDNLKPDIIILDLGMPNFDWRDTVGTIRDNYPEIVLIIYTMSIQLGIIKVLKKLNVNYIISKESGIKDIKTCLSLAIDGVGYLSRDIASRLSDIRSVDNRISDLTKREREVLYLLVENMSTADISEKLRIKKNTVLTYRKSIFAKLNVNKVTEVINIVNRMTII